METKFLVIAIIVVIIIVLIVAVTLMVPRRITITLDPYNLPPTGVCLPVPALYGAKGYVVPMVFRYYSEGFYMSDKCYGSDPNPIGLIIAELDGSAYGVDTMKYGYVVSTTVDATGTRSPLLPTTAAPYLYAKNNVLCYSTFTTSNVKPNDPQFWGCGILYLKNMLSWLEYKLIGTYPVDSALYRIPAPLMSGAPACGPPSAACGSPSPS